METLQDSDGNYRIFNPRTTFGQQSHRNTQYRRFGAFIRRDRNGTVTLVSFGGLHSLYKRFKRLVDGDGWKEVLQDPHALLVVLLEEYARFLDERVWRLMEVLRSVEPVSTLHS